jgi:hypothetical protein
MVGGIMNNQEMIDVIQAHSDGKEIQKKCKRSATGIQEWSRCVNPPAWQFTDCDYRVKPEPPHFYARISATGHVGPVVHHTIEEARRQQKECWQDDDLIIKFIAAPDEEQPF